MPRGQLLGAFGGLFLLKMGGSDRKIIDLFYKQQFTMHEFTTDNFCSFSSKWPHAHEQACMKRGQSWFAQGYPDDKTFHAWPGLRAISPREFDAMTAKGLQFPEEKLRTLDVSQSNWRTHERDGTISCILPISRTTLRPCAVP